MATANEELELVLAPQRAASTKEKLIRELAFELMVQRGLADSEAGRTISNDKALMAWLCRKFLLSLPKLWLITTLCNRASNPLALCDG